MLINGRPYVEGDALCDDGGVIARFSSHWAAVAVMRRLGDRTFRRRGGELDEDRNIEARLQLLRGMP